MTVGKDSSKFSIIKDLSALKSWIDQVSLRGFSMSPPLLIGDEFMLGLCLDTELSEGTCVHMPIDRLQEAAAILFGDRERRVYVHALKETTVWFNRAGIELHAEMFLDVSLAAYLLNPPEPDRDEDWRPEIRDFPMGLGRGHKFREAGSQAWNPKDAGRLDGI
jgi:hypothetical protein